MDDKKNQSINERLEKQRIAEHAREVFQSDPFHGSHDVPAVKHQYQRKHERVRDKSGKVHEVRQYKEISHPVAFSDPLEYVPGTGH
jgi:hypothetical protein